MKPSKKNRTVMSEINVTPLVDVMLVLLIIFMVTAPLLQQGLDINLPKAKGKDMPVEERIDITINKDSSIYLNNIIIARQDLVQKLSAVSKQHPEVFLRADKDISYGLVVEIIGEIKSVGIEKLGIITEPKISINE